MEQLGPESRIVLGSLPYLACAVCVAMAYQFNRTRLLLAALGVVALYWLIQTHLQVSLDNPDAARLFLVASLALPLLLAYLVLIGNGVMWAAHSYYLYAWDAFLWIFGFWAIELNLAEWEMERVEQLQEQPS